jgi:SAM-dependent methyltransferase
MTAALAIHFQTRQSEWFASWFDSAHYRRLYAHRDEAEAARFGDALLAHLRPAAGSAMLDLGCGTGRYARRLAANGFAVTGLDLAPDSVRIARTHEQEGLRFARHDMRVPFGDGVFDYVFNLFTSFGYFATAGEHLAVVRNISHSLKSGGRVVLDYLNVRRAEAELRPRETIVRDGIRYQITRWADAAHIFKRIVIGDNAGVTHEERVAKFTIEDFRLMFMLYGMTLEESYGDYGLGAFDASGSPRLVMVARKTGTARDSDYLRERFLRMRLSVSGEIPR